MPKDIFACLFSIHNIISLSCHEQVSLSVHDMINLLYYKLYHSPIIGVLCFKFLSFGFPDGIAYLLFSIFHAYFHACLSKI